MRDVWTRALAEKVDRLSIDSHGVSARRLMETAGAGVASVFLRRFSLNRPILVLCGHGNNGGDGYVAARSLHELGAGVTVVGPDDDLQRMTPAAREQRASFESVGGKIASFTPGCLARLAGARPVVIDAVFGLGLRGPLKEGTAKALLAEAATLQERSVIAVDIPSGLAADDFSATQTLLPADVTVTFGAPKPVHLLSPARALCGDVEVLDIGFAPAAIAQAWDEATLRWRVGSEKDFPRPPLGREAHKYTRGHVLVVGGSPGKTGAPQLAALAALRAGAGWVTVALPEKATLPPELTEEDFFRGGILDATRFLEFIRERNVKSIVIGPGTMTSPMTEDVMLALRQGMDERGLFVVLDAGALHDLGARLEKTPLQASQTVLTPHPGEWRKLAPSDELALRSAEDIAQTLATLARWGVTALYKSATPIVFDPGSPRDLTALTTRTNALGKAGSGDILSGVVAATGARGLNAATAALTAQALVQRHAASFALRHGEDALTAADLIELLGS